MIPRTGTSLLRRRLLPLAMWYGARRHADCCVPRCYVAVLLTWGFLQIMRVITAGGHDFRAVLILIPLRLGVSRAHDNRAPSACPWDMSTGPRAQNYE